MHADYQEGYISLCHLSSIAALSSPDDTTDPWTYVRRIVGESRSSFVWGMRVLPKSRRRAIYAVYAFSRVVDNIADGPGAPSAKQRALAGWHSEVDRLFAGNPQHPLTKALEGAVRDYELPQEEFHALIDGMETDARPRVRMTSMEDLLLYCRRVAGAVGVLCIHIFGLCQEPGPHFAIALGNAFQITNILRDIQEDVALDRLYIPREVLCAHGVESEPLTGLIAQRGLAAACADLAALAQSRYAEAECLMQRLGWWRTRPPALMNAIYKATLDRLVARGWTQWDEAVRPGGLGRLWLIVRHGLR